MSLIFIVAIKAEIVNLVTSVFRGLDFKGGGVKACKVRSR